MKLFAYKSLFISLLIFILYQATIGYTTRNIETKIYNTISKEKTKLVKDKLRSEIRAGLEKDQILSKDDAKLINNFLEKITLEIKDAK